MGQPVLDRDLSFTSADFRRIREMVYRQAGISLNETKANMAYARLSRRLRKLGLNNFSQYLDYLGEHPSSPEWQAFINALTTNLTAFFRESHHFDELAGLFAAAQPGAPFRVWSAAASTGEEPYSIAMTLAAARSRPGKIEILASDIDTQVLQAAASGIYPIERLAKLDKALVQRFFLKGRGAFEGQARVRPEVSGMIHFFQLNLTSPNWPDLGRFDAIFCRNVMIYFDKPTQLRLLERMAALMTPSSRLFLGHSENIQFLTGLFVSSGRTSYRLASASRSEP
ncbi:CheR family methyltransferase [Paludibacterium paludis]|uniref:Chemotaxis protein methyltransferase n=1 Tax=Paludibacterium paludis TaxID=1225769 RepID=A0A918U8S9_9NEIS|nr:CheR family methyltransferase [Paludibacterium paludis]GGY10372.1 chemotaxis protein methyltransferase [Paludibacterium paludis]